MQKNQEGLVRAFEASFEALFGWPSEAVEVQFDAGLGEFAEGVEMRNRLRDGFSGLS